MPEPGRRFLCWARRSICLGLALVLIGAALWHGPGHTGVGVRSELVGNPPPGGGGSMNVSLTATDQPAFSPASLTAVAGDVIHFQVRNVGQFNHTFTVATLSNVTLPPNETPQRLNGFFAKNGSLVNLTLLPGRTAFANVSLPSTDAGATLEFVSLVPYQFQAGMFGFLHVISGASSGTYALSTNTSASALAFLPNSLEILGPTAFPISVAISVTNLGSTPHTFWIEGQNNNTLNPGNFSSYFANHTPLASVNVPTTPGQTVWANFSISGKGAYEFICTIAGHFNAGMSGWLYVGWAPAPPPAPPGTALVDAAFLIGGGALLLLSVLLTLVATFLGRFPRSPPKSGYH